MEFSRRQTSTGAAAMSTDGKDQPTPNRVNALENLVTTTLLHTNTLPSSDRWPGPSLPSLRSPGRGANTEVWGHGWEETIRFTLQRLRICSAPTLREQGFASNPTAAGAALLLSIAARERAAGNERWKGTRNNSFHARVRPSIQAWLRFH